MVVIRRYNRILLVLFSVVTYMKPMMRTVVISRTGLAGCARAFSYRNLPYQVQLGAMSSRWSSGLICRHAVRPEKNWKLHAQVYKIAPGSRQEQLQRLIVFANNKAEKFDDYQDLQRYWRNRAKHYEVTLQEHLKSESI